jgi:CO dehydrogenase nickel-insertion accessory protein CooC1
VVLPKNINCLYIIVEPTIKSVQTAQHIKNLAEKLKIPQIIFVAN